METVPLPAESPADSLTMSYFLPEGRAHAAITAVTEHLGDSTTGDIIDLR
jgi:hypothetical protein